MMTFVGDYTRMCFVYLLKDESQSFETFKNFHNGLEMNYNGGLVTFILVMKGNTQQMNLNLILEKMGLGIKSIFLNIMVWQKE